MEDAVYFWLTKDTAGANLNGNKNYIIHFEASQIPQARAFWSLTLYTKDFFMAKNMPLNRHMLNSNSGMKLGADGSLDIYLQAEDPGKEKETNWLPVPQEEYFTLLRVYWPEGDFLTGKWRIPDISEVK
jgi:hypothetical protein